MLAAETEAGRGSGRKINVQVGPNIPALSDKTASETSRWPKAEMSMAEGSEDPVAQTAGREIAAQVLVHTLRLQFEVWLALGSYVQPVLLHLFPSPRGLTTRN